MKNSKNTNNKNKSKKKNLLYAVGAPAVGFGIKGVVQGVTEEKTREFLAKQLAGVTPKTSITARSMARTLGTAVPSIATTPILLKGVKDIREGKKEKGLAEIGLASALFGAGKEAITHPILKHYGIPEATSYGKAIVSGTISSALKGTPKLLALLAATGQLSNKEDKKRSLPEQLIRAGLTGGALSAGFAIPEFAMKDISMFKGPKIKSELLPRLGGRLAEGAVAGILLDQILSKFLPKESEDDLTKMADEQQSGVEDKIGLKIKLKPHQKIALLKFIDNQGKLILAHEMGTGKTITSISASELVRALTGDNKTLVVVPSALRQNYAEQLEKALGENANYKIINSGKDILDDIELTGDPRIDQPILDKAIKAKMQELNNYDYVIVNYELLNRYPILADLYQPKTLVVDEYHRAKNNDSETYKTLMSVGQKAQYVVGLTGTPLQNDSKELVALLNITIGQEVLPENFLKNRLYRKLARLQGFFGGSKLIYGPKQSLTEEDKQLLTRIGKYVSIVRSKVEDQPDKKVEYVETPLSDTQKKYIKLLLDKLDPITRWRIENQIPLSDSQLKSALVKLTKIRLVTNSPHTVNSEMSLDEAFQESPKMQQIVNDAIEHLKNTPDGQVFIFSNFIHGGIDVLSNAFEKLGIPFAVFSGQQSEKERQQILKDYNSGKIKVLLATGAAAEGLNLPNTTLIQIADGHFNPSRLLQVEARGIRSGGLAHRPPEERKVLVKRYIAKDLNSSFIEKLLSSRVPSIDAYLYNIAASKYKTNEALLSQLNQQSQLSPDRMQELINAVNSRLQQKVPLEKRPGTKYEARYQDPQTDKIYYKYNKKQ
jgi:superfamily II DNA or RNA helicase